MLGDDLDGGRAKKLPWLCIVCHGGVNAANVASGQPYPNSGNVHAHFLPFDLNALDYSCDRRFTRAAQEGVFHKLNQGVLEIEAGTSTSPANLDSNNQRSEERRVGKEWRSRWSPHAATRKTRLGM